MRTTQGAIMRINTMKAIMLSENERLQAELAAKMQKHNMTEIEVMINFPHLAGEIYMLNKITLAAMAA